MEGLRGNSRFTRFVANCLDSNPFTLVDVGCSGGLASEFRNFGGNLRAVGVDPNVDEVQRLNSAEKLSSVHYLAAFVDSIDRHRVINNLNVWDRLSVAQTLENRSSQSALYNAREQTINNLWQDTQLTGERVSLPVYLESIGFTDVDFLKIDVDGADFAILQSCKSLLRDARILGIGIEVNFYGDAHPETNTFHNIDRFMRAQGYALFDLSVRRYSVKALPSRYEIAIPAQTKFGRPYQGDALYLRDVGAKDGISEAIVLDDGKLLKLAALFSLFGMPDGAAEILDGMTEFAGREEGLDILARQADPDEVFGGYRAYVDAFARDDSWFWPALGGPASSEVFHSNLPGATEDGTPKAVPVGAGLPGNDWTARMVPGPAGTMRPDGSLESLRCHGHVAFGPNQPLSQGHYEARVSIAVRRRFAVRRTRAYVDVAVSGRQVTAVAVPSRRGDHNLVLPFVVGAKDAFSGVEVRLHTNGRRKLILCSVVVIEQAPPGEHESPRTSGD